MPTPAAKRKMRGSRCSDRQLGMLIDYMFANQLLDQAATESTFTTAEGTTLWDVITDCLNMEGLACRIEELLERPCVFGVEA